MSTNGPVKIPPRVPPTPAPQQIADIKDNALERFAGVICIQKSRDEDIKDYFIDYDYWEPYSETKAYSKRPHKAAYKGMMKEYRNYLCYVKSMDDEGLDEYYVVAKRIPSELEKLEPYCTCLTCSACVINPLKYIWCPHCTRCIKGGVGFANPEYVEKAKELKLAQETAIKRPNLISKIGPRWVKVAEIGVMATAILSAIIYVW